MDRRKICRFFQRGSCKKQKCPFVHLRQTRKNCEFFMQGYCKKGDNCNFYHPAKETEEQQHTRKNYKPTLEKKEHKPKVEQQGPEEREPTQQPHQEEQHKHGGHQAKPVLKEEEESGEDGGAGEDHGMLGAEIDERFKLRQINFLLGLGEDEESDEEEQRYNESTKFDEQPKKKPMNFSKTYPKKFPDYTKTLESKQRIADNQTLFFKGVKFLQLLNKTQDPTQKQRLQIIRKFQDSYRLWTQQDQQQSDRVFGINLRPILYEPEILLHFELDEDFIEIKVDSRQYPQDRAVFEILNKSIPEQYKLKLTELLHRAHQKKSIFQTLKYLANNFEKIYAEAKSKLQDEYYSQIELEQKITKKLSEQKQKHHKKKEKKQKPGKSESKKAGNPDVQVIHFPQNEKITVGNMNYDLQVESLQIQNCQYVLAERLLLFLECTCQKRIVHILEADRKQLKIGVQLRCKKCSMIISIAIQREVMQLRSLAIGKLGIQNGRLVEVGGISWKVGCECDNEIIRPKICMPGYRLNTNCFQCFKNINVSYMGLKFHNPFIKQAQLIENGRQLPGKGACKHMKLSFRWIRYGCCGRSFSCDQCHTNGSVYPHQKMEGITMLCGFCSAEQLVNKECQYCKRELVRGVDKGGHWEGGLGCRDKTLLSRKDAKKYAGLSKPQNK